MSGCFRDNCPKQLKYPRKYLTSTFLILASIIQISHIFEFFFSGQKMLNRSNFYLCDVPNSVFLIFPLQKSTEICFQLRNKQVKAFGLLKLQPHPFSFYDLTFIHIVRLEHLISNEREQMYLLKRLAIHAKTAVSK